jgi:double-strand break repair protein AddB
MSDPHLYTLPPGADLAVELVRGILDRWGDRPPQDQARITLYVNTRRTQRAVRVAFAAHGPRLLPRIGVLSDIGLATPLPGPRISPLRRKLELALLVRKLLETEPDLAPRAAVFDLASSLADLLDEMQGEGVGLDALEALDLTDHADYWAQSLKFLRLVRHYTEHAGTAADTEARQRQAILTLIDHWATTPPQHPTIVAGSTGSRGSTALLLDAVARLPLGHVVLPGVDADMPDALWRELTDGAEAQDHSQHRFAALMRRLDVGRGDLRPWTTTPPPAPARNALVSLALRPAPVTDQWMTEGGRLSGIDTATADVTLVEAPSDRAEALAIALRLRQAAEDGQRAALVTPDRMLTRRVTAALDRWGIEPDDSAGRPLALSPPGRMLRLVAALGLAPLQAEDLLVLLKHPLTHSAGDRGPHLRLTNELELFFRKNSVAFPANSDLAKFAENQNEEASDWLSWLADLTETPRPDPDPLAHHLDRLEALATRLAAGPKATGSGDLFEQNAGRETRRVLAALREASTLQAPFAPEEFRDLLTSELQAVPVRDRDAPRSNIMIWGTLEARVQGADLVILGGLNEGTWPEAATADPWLNRPLRRQAGLLLPDRRIGLSAHDFQQAVAAREVWLTRAIRNAEAQTVASRWLNRLTNLLGGLTRNGGEQALMSMKARGHSWLALAERLEAPETDTKPAPRPSPRPPLAARPDRLSVTQIETLIRDPYAIYARHILRLRPLDPLRPAPDAPLRGIALHEIFDRFVVSGWSDDPDTARRTLLSIAESTLETHAPWPATRAFWLARIERIADWFIAQESTRRAGHPVPQTEVAGHLTLPDVGFTLTAKADRIDRLPNGTVKVYDYKTGAPPTSAAVHYFRKQLVLEAAMAAEGAFEGLSPAIVPEITYIGLGATPRESSFDLTDPELAQLTPRVVLPDLRRLIAAYADPTKGYTARNAIQLERFGSDYDHLARFGEWSDADAPKPEDVG